MCSLSCPDAEPSAAELAAIEAELPVLRAELRVTTAEINAAVNPSALARRQVRRASKRALKLRAQWGCTSTTSPTGTPTVKRSGFACAGVAA